MKPKVMIALTLSGVVATVALNEAEVKPVEGLAPHTEVETVNVYPRPDLGASVLSVAGTTFSGDAIILSKPTLPGNYA
ncbi:MAG: hypothetical protein V1933_01285 [Candidatus Omnitrophota bacterium]